MGYTPEVINSRDPITAAWGNKIEQELARRGNYMGVVSTEADLPNSPEVGDWYLVLDKGLIYVWNGSKWIKIGGGMMGYEQNNVHLELTDTNGSWDGIKYQPVALGAEYPQNIEVVFDIVVNAGTVTAVVRVYDMNGTLLIDATPVSVPADGNRRTYKYHFDLSSLSRPNTIVAQLELNCSSTVNGYQDFIEVRWY